ncbi:MAG: leucine-rich repeat protein [Lachnospiraceae bacterium]|nr:leucine-rich repeat protein [Lachnospiraceae bacterium]
MKKGWANELKMVLCTSVLLFVCGTTVYANPKTDSEQLVTDDNLPVGGWEAPEAHEVDIDVEVKTNEPTKCTRLFNSGMDSVFVKGVGNNGYNSLTSAQKEYYKKFEEAATEFMQSNADISQTTMNSDGDTAYIVARVSYASFGLSYDSAYQVYNAFNYDHPAYYWISNTLWYSTGGQYFYLCTDETYASATERNSINNMIVNGVKSYAALVDDGMDDLDKISIIHDRIVQDVAYAYKNGTNTPETAKWAHSVQGVFDDNYRQVVCEGYADTFSLMMNYIGIPNYYIVGTANSSGAGGGGGHAWNAVSDDGGATYMYIDLTWDDIKEGGYYYKYFGMPKSDFENSHYAYVPTNTEGEWLYALPNNISDTLAGTYYYRGGFYCNDTNYDSFAKYIKTKSRRLGTTITYMTNDFTVTRAVAQKLGISSSSYYPISYLGVDYCVVVYDVTDTVDISDAVVTLAKDSYEYSPEGNMPAPKSVSVDGVKLIKGVNYTVSYEDNINAGDTAKLIITGKGNYTGSKTKTFTITKRTIAGVLCTVSPSKYTYSGSANTPSVSISIDNTSLKAGTDYSVTYEDNTKAGKASVTITGNGNYTGVIENYFTISPKELSVTGMKVKDKTYDGTTDAEITSYGTLVGVCNDTDDVSINVTNAKAEFEDKNVGDNKKVVFYGYSLSGDDAANYSLDMSDVSVTGAIIASQTLEQTGSEQQQSSQTSEQSGNGQQQSSQTSQQTSSVTSQATYTVKSEGTTLDDNDATATYVVTSTQTETPTVSYSITSDAEVKDVVVPETILVDGVEYKVTSIADNAFKGVSTLKSVTIPASVESIGDSAFENCKELTKITIPVSCKKIGNKAFGGCKKLKTIIVKTTKLTSKNVSKKTFKGIKNKVVIKVPKKMLAKYKKLFRKKGLSKKVKIKKI